VRPRLGLGRACVHVLYGGAARADAARLAGRRRATAQE